MRLAEVLSGILQAESTLHRKIALPLLPSGRLTMVMDRTTWHYRQTPLNILVLGALLGGVVLPLAFLGRTAPMRTLGRSSGAARILLVARLLKVLPARRWDVLIADRRASVASAQPPYGCAFWARSGAVLPKKEFVRKEWCVYLRWRGIKRCFRIRENTRMDDLLARDQFTDLQPGEVRTVFKKAWVYGSWTRVVVTRSPVGERVIVASDLSVLDTLLIYRKRWGVECTFSAMKSRGLGLEATHMTAPDRLSRLFGLLCIVLA